MWRAYAVLRAALLSALNANLYGASRMAYSLAERGEAPRLLAAVSKARVPVGAVLASVAFGLVTVVLELAFPGMVLDVLLNIVGSTCLLVWMSALLAQLALRLRADREDGASPAVPGFPGELSDRSMGHRALGLSCQLRAPA